MSSIVLDASVTLAWCFEDEVSAFADGVLSALQSREALVPSLWKFEVANGIAVAERRKRLRPLESDQFLQLLEELPIAIDDDASPSDLLRIARETKLSAYDTAYLELALRRRAALATEDRALARAATRLGVTLLDR